MPNTNRNENGILRTRVPEEFIGGTPHIKQNLDQPKLSISNTTLKRHDLLMLEHEENR